MRSLEFIRRSTPLWLILVIDLTIVAVSVIVAYLIRFDFRIPAKELVMLPMVAAYIILIRGLTFLIMRTYAGIVRYTSTEDVVRIFLVLLMGSSFFVITNLCTYLAYHRFYIPFSIISIEFLSTTMVMIASRILVKITYLELQNPSRGKSRVVILGGGDEALVAKRALDRVVSTNYKVVAILDDNPNQKGKKIEGVEIRPTKDIHDLLSDNQVGSLIIASRTVDPSSRENVVDACLAKGVKVWNVPPMSKWINGELSFNQLRGLRIEDLLDREVIKLDEASISRDLAHRTVLVTGAAGSIGSELTRQILRFSPSKVILLDIAETPLHEMGLELSPYIQTGQVEIILGDVRDPVKLRNLFEKYKPELVYHAAAYKHVPMMEAHPSEAIHTNVEGTLIVAELAMEFGACKFILVSTDKAVNPSSVMGASKRIAEMTVQALNSRNETRFIITRFGNVLGSSGSVIPLFYKQIESGGPITITHPEVTRFFMTIPEASSLVLEAAAFGKGGEIFLFDMGASVRIIDLAKKMISLANLDLEREIQIEFTGLRPGEKLTEELLHSAENSLPTHHPRIMIAKQRDNDSEQMLIKIRALIESAKDISQLDVVLKMKSIVPEYKSSHSVYEKLDVS